MIQLKRVQSIVIIAVTLILAISCTELSTSLKESESTDSLSLENKTSDYLKETLSLREGMNNTNNSTGYNADQLKAMALSENPSVLIAYEKMYQARKQIKVARARFLPRLNMGLFGLGSGGVLETVLFVSSIIPTPSKWYNYKKNKYLAKAEAKQMEAIRLNIQMEVERQYYTIAMESLLLASLRKETARVAAVLKYQEENRQFGFVGPEKVREAKRMLVSYENQTNDLAALLSQEISALKLMLNAAYDADLPLKDPTPIDLSYILGLDVDQMQTMALANSYELAAQDELKIAAKYAKKEAKWSFLNFYGVGFSYAEKIRISKANIEQLTLKKAVTEQQIRYQVYFRHVDLIDQIRRVEINRKKLEASKKALGLQFQLYSSHKATLPALVDVELKAFKDQRDYISTLFLTYIKLAELNRHVDTTTVVGGEG